MGNLKKTAILIIILVSSAFSLLAKTEVVTLHLTASVPARTTVSIADERISVGVNSDQVTFAAYDRNGRLVTDSPDFDYALASDGMKLCFTAE